ncbi:MAG: YdcF family protein [Rhizobiaceae bacterium]|nr:YdcF family protein [Rhizobiaceae bacterium]
MDGNNTGATSGGRRSFGRVAFWVVGLAALLFAGGFVLFSDHVSTLAAPDEPEAADAIIVLTGGHYRLDTAVELLRTGKGRKLLISGVNPMAGEDDLQRATGADHELFDCCIDIDHAALDTVGNAAESAKWVTNNAYVSAILVTNNYHMPRSLLEMRRANSALTIVPYPVVNTPLGDGEWIRQPDALRVLFTEYTKYLAALARSLFDYPDPIRIEASAPANKS